MASRWSHEPAVTRECGRRQVAALGEEPKAELGVHGASVFAGMAQRVMHAACVDVMKAVAEHGVHGFFSVLTVAGSGVHG